MSLQWPRSRTGTEVDNSNIVNVDMNVSLENAGSTAEGHTITTETSDTLEKKAITFINNNKTIFEELSKL